MVAPTSGNVQVPALPASLSSWAPRAASEYRQLLIEVIESTAIGGSAEFKRVNPPFLDGSSATISTTHQASGGSGLSNRKHR